MLGSHGLILIIILFVISCVFASENPDLFLTATSSFDQDKIYGCPWHDTYHNSSTSPPGCSCSASCLACASKTSHAGSISASAAILRAASPTSVTLPSTDVTTALIKQALDVNAQQQVTIHSLIPQFTNGVITIVVQFDGSTPETISINATDSLPCSTIGSNPAPNLVLLPQILKGGLPELNVPDCLIIAVSKDNDPRYIKYWVQKPDGTVHAILGDNYVHFIDRMDFQVSSMLSVRVASTDDHTKRSTMAGSSITPSISRSRIGSSHQVMMTEVACKAMTCFDTGKPAMYNPFTATCWCIADVYAEIGSAAPGVA